MFSMGDAVWVDLNGNRRKGVVSAIDPMDDRLPYQVVCVSEDGFEERSWFTKSELTCASEDKANDCAPCAFKVGDVVMIRSGGPWMTASQLNGSEIGCAWFDGSGESLRREYFPAECLKKVTNEP